jgi:hypothetical protein
MADRAVAEARQTYLVEQYRPGLTVDGLKQWAVRVREATGELEREGKSVRYLRSTIVPADESLLCVLERPAKSWCAKRTRAPASHSSGCRSCSPKTASSR